MLKVVGASWVKTRISSCIIAGAGLLAIGAFFLDLERPEFDGNYCATAYWTPKTGHRFQPWGQVSDMASVPINSARACYKDSTLDNGWSKLEIDTQAGYPDRVQAFAAGMLEGVLTWKNIYDHWDNTINAECEKDEESQNFCIWLRDTLSNNYANIKEMADAKGKHDHYWHQVRLFYHQLDGLEFGWRRGVKRSRQDLDIPQEDFLLLNAAADMKDLRIFYRKIMNIECKDHDYNTGSILMRLVRDKTQMRVLLGHSSDGSYQQMLRMQKKYRFHYHLSSDMKSHVVPGTNIAFTGYPGGLASTDDFYVVQGKMSKLAVLGVSLAHKDANLWNNKDLQKSVLFSARVMAANRLAHSGRTWSRVFSRNPTSGAKQWLVVNFKHVQNYFAAVMAEEDDSESTTTMANQKNDEVDEESSEKLLQIENYFQQSSSSDTHGLVWIVDQLPGRLHAEDVTKEVVGRGGYWFSTGKPFFEELQTINEVSAPEINDSAISRALQSTTSLDGLARIFQTNAFRGDLLPTKPIPYGNIDMKLYSESTLDTVEYFVHSGPLNTQNLANNNNNNGKSVPPQATSVPERGESLRFVRSDNKAITQKQQPFSWSNTKVKARHNGQPNEFDFARLPITFDWQ